MNDQITTADILLAISISLTFVLSLCVGLGALVGFLKARRTAEQSRMNDRYMQKCRQKHYLEDEVYAALGVPEAPEHRSN